MVLKKELENKRIVGIEQNGLDRIINFNFVNFKLVVELFGGGNLFIVRDGIIEYVYKRREFKDRKLKVNEEYRLPPQRHNIFSTSYEEFERMIKSCKFDVVRALAINFNFGGEYAEEICFKAGVDKNRK
jgi:Predicted RNA-binding protein homologous to eukaryotic snRNP